ncbi:transposase [Streptomyces rimosus]|uniref:transposase n=1 Tax=Streptomyces rimosus TaxID=1927 RepID=UPI0037D93120
MRSGRGSSRCCRTGHRGGSGHWRDHREVIDAIAFKFHTGTQWMHLPEKYGNWRGVYPANSASPSSGASIP